MRPDQQRTALVKIHHARVPPAALTLRATGLLMTEEHEHVCWPEDTSAPFLQNVLLEQTAAHRDAQTLHARVPPPALSLRTRSLLRTMEHGHACSPGDTSAPSLQILILEQSSSAPSCSDAARSGPPACADAAHHQSLQHGGAWACLLARRHVSTIPTSAECGAGKQRTVLLRRYKLGTTRLRRSCPPPVP